MCWLTVHECWCAVVRCAAGRGAVLSAHAKAAFTFTPPVGKAIRLSSASLAHNAKSTARASLLVSCPSTSPDSSGTPITVTTLTAAAHPSTLLDLYLLGGQEVALQAKGDGDIHVGGYCTVQDIGEEDDEEDEGYDDSVGEGYLIDEHQAAHDDEDEDSGGGWTVPGGAKRRAAKAQAIRSIIDELREDEEDDDEADDSDFIGELLDDEGEDGHDDDDDDDGGDEDDDDEDDAEMYEFGEEDEDAASNEELADAIRQQLAGKIRVIETDEDDSDDDREGPSEKQPAKKATGKKTATTEGKASSKSAKPAATTASAPIRPSQLNGTTAGKKRAVEENATPQKASASKKPKTAASATPSTPSTAASAAASAKTVKCAHCSRLFTTTVAMEQHAEMKHKAA